MDFDIYKITNLTSRAYFEDVLQAFYSKNYRSSILLLYNLIIYDLYSKLRLMEKNGLLEVSGLYSENLIKRFKEIETLRKKNQVEEGKYSTIEKELYNIYEKEHILRDDTNNMLQYLKKIRNKCAHPIFSKEYEYYSPTKEECSMFITKSYSDILVINMYFKDPYSIMKKTLEDEKWDDLYTEEFYGCEENQEKIKSFNLYFEEKFLSMMNDTNFVKLFQSLIDEIFKKNEDKDFIKYQHRRYKLLQCLLGYISKNGKIDLLRNHYNWGNVSEENFYDQNKNSYDLSSCKSLTYIFQLIYDYKIYNFFDTEIKKNNILLYNYLKKNLDDNVEYFIYYYSIFYTGSIDSVIKTRIYNEDNIKNSNDEFYKNILKYYSEYLAKNTILDLLMNLFKKIPNFDGYDCADEMCSILILMVKKHKLDTNDILEILKIMDNNYQIYSSYRKKSKEQFKNLSNLGINLCNYDNLRSFYYI